MDPASNTEIESGSVFGSKAVVRPETAPSPENILALGNLARYLGWIFLALIVGFSIFLCFMLGNSARQVILAKQYEFARLLANNLNHQMYRLFALPAETIFGRIALGQRAQYERLDQVVRQVIQGMNVQNLRIFNFEKIVVYAVNIDDLGRADLAGAEVSAADSSGSIIFRLDSKISLLSAFFSLNVPSGSFVLHAYAPLTVDIRKPASDDNDLPVFGVLEFMQDVTPDVISVLDFQRSIIAIILVSSLLIFVIMILFLTRAESALAARVQEKERLLQQLHQNEKLAGMGRVISGIAHEIRNPLGIICSSAQLLLRRVKSLDVNSAGILQAIYDESQRLSQTVTNFLDYARPKAPRQDLVDIAALLDQALAFLSPEFTKQQVRLKKSYLPPDCAGESTPEGYGVYLIKGDKDLLYRAFYNVLINAVQAVAENARREISLAVRTAPSADYPAGAVEITVADNGPGFEAGDLNRFLDPFFTTKPLGTGLGLPIVSSIVTNHGGTLEIMNRRTEHAAQHPSGALVRIILPETRKPL
ncbi:MAG: two-component sensor histidine kinase [Deltaproteobacteria bacterium]|nr:two-component sensor histidine kinase [Deltaproteobacteria bacterium]